MGRGETDQTKTDLLGVEANAPLGSTPTTQLLSRMLVGLNDPESAVAEQLSSTYALEVPTDTDPLHMLFRLDNGNPQLPEIVACYLGGRQIAVDALVAEQFVSAACQAAPWLYWDE